MSAYLSILRCADGSYYVGTTHSGLEVRIAEHEADTFDGYTARRRPLALVFHQEFERIEDAVAAERQAKGWRREKKRGVDPGRFCGTVRVVAARCIGIFRASRRARSGAPQHEGRC